MLVAHIVFRFDYGGLENGVVNIINGMEAGTVRHAVIALTEASDFARRLRDDVSVHAIGKKPGKDLGAYLRLYKLLRQLKPDIVHTRNMGTMDCAVIAFLARVPVRIHGEHGWDVFDPDGTNRKYRLMRRLLLRFVNRIVTVSEDLQRWLVSVVGIPRSKVVHICNGVDAQRFHPHDEPSDDATGEIIVGSVTRFSEIKDPLNLVEAFIQSGGCGGMARLVMIGDGELYERARQLIGNADMSGVAWLPGSRDDIAEQLRCMDVFVLGSLREGISNTILEAMASCLPVIASDTGGNPELIEDGVNGTLVPPGDREALRKAMCDYVRDADRRARHGQASRDRVVSRFSLDTMVENYRLLYERSLGVQGS